jgi:hypothetical protein
MDALVVDHPAGLPSCGGRPSPPPSRTRSGEVPEEGPKGQLFVRRDGSGKTLGGSRLADDPTGPALGDPELLTEDTNCPPAAVRG